MMSSVLAVIMTLSPFLSDYVDVSKVYYLEIDRGTRYKRGVSVDPRLGVGGVKTRA